MNDNLLQDYATALQREIEELQAEFDTLGNNVPKRELVRSAINRNQTILEKLESEHGVKPQPRSMDELIRKAAGKTNRSSLEKTESEHGVKPQPNMNELIRKAAGKV